MGTLQVTDATQLVGALEGLLKDLDFGLIMMVTGMGVTLLTLFVLALIICLLSRLFPYVEADKQDDE